jgi:predicted CXXCH cytochrome family protein
VTSRWLWLLLPVALLAYPQATAAQLLSPGKLAAVHGDLSGLRKCTNCHALGQRGVANDKCLECHEPLRTRIAERRGFHATVARQDCTDCHKDHFGEDFALVRFDSDTFDHKTIGFELVDAHNAIECGDCHQPRLIDAADVRAFKGEHGALDRTFLGLGTTCAACHATDDPHDSQFGERGCQECHTQRVWDGAERFDHDQTRYRLTGLHRRVQCEDCHARGTRSAPGDQGAYARYAGLSYSSCKSCHDDGHRGRMEGTCASCHNTGGWHRLDRAKFEGRFDHEVTEFSLVGKHVEIECGSCHDRGQSDREGLRLTFVAAARRNEYPRPVAADCLSCHLDYHVDVFQQSAGGPVCESCHTQTDWLPTTYDIGRHNEGSAFALTGAHVATPCQNCHTVPDSANRALQFRFENSECRVCHESDDPHVSQFAGRQCTVCHDTQSFAIAAFDHTNTRYPLDGAHRDVSCNDCHSLAREPDGREYRVYTPLGTECLDCHGGAS